jgi:two-component system cell cycle sensor histidine kinase/response regulator CckA
MTRLRGLSVGTKLVVLIGSVVGALALAVFAVVPPRFERQLRDSLRSDSVGLCQMIASNVGASLVFEDARMAQELLGGAGRKKELLYAVVRRSDGRPLATFRRPGVSHIPESPLGSDWAFSPDGSRLDVETPVVSDGKTIGAVRIGVSLDNVLAEVRRARKGLAGLSLLLFVAGTLAAYWISAFVVRPLRALDAAAERVAGGDRTERVQVRSGDEVGRLAAAFNRMVDRVDSAYRALEEANKGLETRVEQRTHQLEGEMAQRQDAEEALKGSERRYRSLFDENLSGSFLCRPDGELLACNPAFARIFGFRTPEDALQRSFLGLFPSPADAARQIGLLREQGRLWNVELEMRRSDGTPVHVRGSLVGSFEEQELREVRGYLFDTTEQRSLEDQLRQSQKMEAIGRLAGGVAHDFNNLLTVILGFGEMLLSRTATDDPSRSDLEEICRAGERAAALTKQLLAFSRRQVLQPTILDLNEVLRNMTTMLGRLIGEDIHLVTRLAPGLGRVKADAGQIEQVILNLVVNARDAMPKGGKLVLETREQDLDDSFTSTAVGLGPGPHVLLTVADSGVGMDAATQSHLFEPFFTTKEHGKGTGLGLATVYGIVTQSGGYIDVSTEPGRGTSFRIFLPRVEAPAGTANVLSAGPPITRGSETILLVEDEDVVRRLARRALEAAGYDVLESGDGPGALQLLASTDRTVSLILTDVVMPGMSGLEVAAQAAQLRPGIRVLFMSGYTDVDMSGVRKLGSGLLHKPFTAPALTERVRSELDRSLSTPPQESGTYRAL